MNKVPSIVIPTPSIYFISLECQSLYRMELGVFKHPRVEVITASAVTSGDMVCEERLFSLTKLFWTYHFWMPHGLKVRAAAISSNFDSWLHFT